MTRPDGSEDARAGRDLHDALDAADRQDHVYATRYAEARRYL